MSFGDGIVRCRGCGCPDDGYDYPGGRSELHPVLREAYAKALADPSFRTTDDCGTVLRYLPDTPVYVVEGDVANMKLTYQEDVFLLERLYQLHHA